MKRILAIVAALSLSLTAFADEGMWLLPLLQKMNGKALKEAGCKLSPEEIYSINHSSLKDAIIHFGGGCTGEIISGDGLGFEDGAEFLPRLLGHLLGIVQERVVKTGRQDDRGGVHRPGEGPAARLVATGLQPSRLQAPLQSDFLHVTKGTDFLL